MRNIFLILSFLFFAISCSSDDPFLPDGGGDGGDGNGPDIPGKPFVPVKIGIYASAKEANVLEDVQFTLYPDRTCNMYEVRQSYDSLVWLVPEMNGIFKALKPNQFSFGWAHSFSKVGKYHTILRGFKDDNKILDDTIIVNINNKREILCYNWQDIKESQGGIHGTADIFELPVWIFTRKVYENNAPALEIYMQLYGKAANSDENIRQYQENEQEAKIYDYLTGLYRKPKLSYEKDAAAIAQAYKSNFKHGDKTLLPRYIWETNTSKIVLLQGYDEWLESNYYFALAEPNK